MTKVPAIRLRRARVATRALVALAVVVVSLLSVPVRSSLGAPGIDARALLHDTRSMSYRRPFGAIPAGASVHLGLRTAHNGASSVSLLVIRTDASQRTLSSATYKLVRSSQSARYDHWQISLKMAGVGIYNYAFQVHLGSEALWYSSNALQLGGAGQAYRRKPSVFFELTAYDPSFKAPSWAKDAVIYQIFPDRFFNGDPSNDHSGMDPVYDGQHPTVHQNWSDLPQPGGMDFFGGDLQGIIDKLPYLRGLGVNTLYLNPIFEAPSNHKYDTADYMTIDPRFGTMETFRTLMNAAKADGIRLILDGVFNHTGSDSVYFNRYGHFPNAGAYQSKSSPYYPWYSFSQWPAFYQGWNGNDTLPQLNENVPVEDFIFRTLGSVAQYWASQGTAGWRLDAADQKSHAWWQAFRTSFKAAYPDDIMIGEATGGPIDALPWLMGNEMDGVMNYRFSDAILGFFAAGRGSVSGRPISASLFFGELMSVLEEYPEPAIYSSMNLVDSHDTIRILTNLLGNKTALRAVATLQMTWKGAPTIYYGDEAGVAGFTDPDDRRTFPWGNEDTSLQDFYRKLISIRQSHPALRDGSVSPLLLDNMHRVLGYLRADSTERIAVLINNGKAARTVSIAIPNASNEAQFVDALGGGTFTLKNGKLRVSIPALTSRILVPVR